MEIGESAELANELVMEATGEGHGGHKPGWHNTMAAFTLVLALLTAIGALLAGITAHESLLERTEESIEVTIIEGDRVTIEILRAKHDILISLGETPDPTEAEAIARYDEEVAELSGEVEQQEADVQTVSSTHLIFSVAVTLMSVGIGISGMSIIVDTRKLWIAGIVFGVIGTIGLLVGVSQFIGWT